MWCEAFTGTTRVFLGWHDGLAVVGQVSPPVVGVIAEREIEALHRVSGVVNGADLKMTDCDRQALSLLSPFRSDDPIEPINPDWHPAAIMNIPDNLVSEAKH